MTPARVGQWFTVAAFVAGLALMVAAPAAGVLVLLVLAGTYLLTRRRGGANLSTEIQLLLFASVLLRVAMVCVFQWVIPRTSLGAQLMAADPRLTSLTRYMTIGLFYDELKYEDVAWGIAQWWTSGGWLPPHGNLLTVIPGYYLQVVGTAFGTTSAESYVYVLPHVELVAALYVLVGRDPLAARVLFAILGAFAPLIVYYLTRAWFGVRAARIAGWAAVVEPAFVFWSGWILKDLIVAEMIGLVLLAATEVVRKTGARWLLMLFASEALLTSMRYSVGIYLGMLIPVAAAGAAMRRNRALLLAALLLFGSSGVLWLEGAGFMGSAYLNTDLSLNIWRSRLGITAEARTALPDSDYNALHPAQAAPAAPSTASQPAAPAASTPPSAAAAVPAATPATSTAATDMQDLSTALAQPGGPPMWAVMESLERNVSHVALAIGPVLIGPLPSSADTAKDKLSMLFMPSWYLALIFGIVGAVQALRRGERALLLPIVFVLATVLYLSLVETSLGNIVRHRLMLEVALLPLASSGLLTVLSAWRSGSERVTRVTVQPVETRV